MIFIKRNLLFLLLISTLIFSKNAYSQYTLTNDDVVVTNGIITECSYSFAQKDIIIPQILDGQTVTGIESKSSSTYGVYSNKGITAIELPSTIKHIGDYAFYNNDIDTIAFVGLPNLNYVGIRAFYSNELTTIDLSACQKLQTIHEYAFYNNDAGIITLPELTLSGFEGWVNSNGDYYSGNETTTLFQLQYIYRALVPYTLTDNDVEVVDGIITSCSYDFAASMITIPGTLDGQTIKGIEDGFSYQEGIFYNKYIVRLTLPNLDSIGDYAFTGNIIEEVDFSNCTNLKKIKQCAFQDNKIDTIDLSACTSLEEIGNSAFVINYADSISLENCNSLQYVGSEAFKYNEFKSLDLGDCPNLMYLGSSAFAYNNIADLDLSLNTKLKTIGYDAFSGNSFGSFELPTLSYTGFVFWRDDLGHHYPANSSVDEFDWEYHAVIKYTLTDADVEMINDTLTNCTYDFEFTDIIIPENLDGQTVKSVGDRTFYEKTTTSVEFPSTLEHIGDNAFNRNSKLYRIQFNGQNLEKIGFNAFSSTTIDTLDLSGQTNLSSIGSSAFNCTLRFLSLENCSAIDSLFSNSFYGSSLDSVNILGCEALTYIGANAISGVSGLTVKLPQSANSNTYGWVNTLNQHFESGDAISDLSVVNRIPIAYTLTDEDVVVTNGFIESCSYNYQYSDIIIPSVLDAQTVIGIRGNSQGVFEEKGITNVVLPNTLDTIGECAFKLNEIDSLDLRGINPTFIGDEAFRENSIDILKLDNCTNLEEIGDYAFYQNSIDTIDISNCASLTKLGQHSFGLCTSSKLVLNNCTNLKTIGKQAFYHNPIEDLSMSNCSNIEVVGDEAFYWTDLTSFDFSLLPNLAYVGYRAFYYCDIATADFTANTNLCYIGDEAFYRTDLSSFFLPTHATSTLDWIDENGDHHAQGSEVSNLRMFYRLPAPYTLTDNDVVMDDNILVACSYHFGQKDIIIPDLLDGKIVRYIANRNENLNGDDGIFEDKGICSVQLPQTIESVGSYAFAENEIDSIDLSTCTLLERINDRAFYDNEIEKIIWNTNLTYLGDYAFSGNRFSFDMIGALANCDKLLYIGHRAIYNSSTGSSFVLPTPDYSNFEHWLQDGGYPYPGGSVVSSSYYYEAYLTPGATYDITFTVSDGTNPIENAIVDLDGQVQYTNSSGYTVFEDYSPDSYSYSVSASGFGDETGTVTIIDSDVAETIELSAMGTPEFEIINNTTFADQEDQCFGAANQIVVAEDGNAVEFQSGSSTNLIAGQSIRFLPGTIIRPGAYVHAWITDDNTFCDGLPESIVRVQEPEEKSLEIISEVENEDDFEPDLKTLKVYPNPSDGRFTIDIRGYDEGNDVLVYNSMGQLVREFRVWNKGEVELFDVKKGIYLVKVKNSSLFQRIVIR